MAGWCGIYTLFGCEDGFFSLFFEAFVFFQMTGLRFRFELAYGWMDG